MADLASSTGTWKIARDPALLGAVVLAVIQVILTLVPVPAYQVSLVNAFAATAVGFVVAVVVRSDRWVPSLLGLIKAAGALVIGFGLDWSAQSQSAVMLLAAAVTAVITRTQVVAPIPLRVDVPPPPPAHGARAL